jgi:acetyl esterase/lipase
MKKLIFAAGLGLVSLVSLRAQEPQKFTRTEDVVYGRKFGTALTLDVFEPAKKNGAAIFWVVSGGFRSDHNGINPKLYQPLLERGYTVFAVVHGSQPRFIVPEIQDDIHRAIRFVRTNAARWGVDPGRFGISGSSAGGHLSLAIGTQGGPGKADAKDRVDRASSAVQAVACFYPPSDFLNFSKPGEFIWEHVSSSPHTPALSFGPRGATRDGQREMGAELSTINYVTAKMPPTLVIHGDSDRMVPLYQSKMLEQKCREVGATFRLVVKPGADHGWPGIEKDVPTFADWFDHYLVAAGAQAR